MPFPCQPYRTVRRTRNPKLLAVNGVSIYPLSLPYGIQQGDMGFTPAYGSFSRTTTLTLAKSTEEKVSFDTTDVASGVAFASGTTTKIQVSAAGIYRVYTEIQCSRTTGLGSIYSYLKQGAVGGVASNVVDSGMVVAVNGNIQVILPDENILSMNANDYIEVILYCPDDANSSARAYAASAPLPVVPSVTVIVERIA